MLMRTPMKMNHFSVSGHTSWNKILQLWRFAHNNYSSLLSIVSATNWLSGLIKLRKTFTSVEIDALMSTEMPLLTQTRLLDELLTDPTTKLIPHCLRAAAFLHLAQLAVKQNSWTLSRIMRSDQNWRKTLTPWMNHTYNCHLTEKKATEWCDFLDA